MLHDPPDARLDVGRAAAAIAVEDLCHHQVGAGRNTRDAPAVVLVRRRDATHVGAMAVVILGVAVARAGVAIGIDAARALRDLAGQVLLGEMDPGVDDADADAGARRPTPRTRHVGDREAPLLVEQRVVRRARWPRRDHGEYGGKEECERHCAQAHPSVFAVAHPGSSERSTP